MVFDPGREKLTEQAQAALRGSQELVVQKRQNQWDAEHLLIGLLRVEDSLAVKLLEELNIDVGGLVVALEQQIDEFPTVGGNMGQVQMFMTPRVGAILEGAKQEATRLRDELIGADHLLVAVAKNADGDIAELFKVRDITEERVYQALLAVRGSARVTDSHAESKYQALSKYSVDLTALARAGELDPVIGRELEIRRVMQTLTRRTKNNPVLIGDAGVGKTAIVEGLMKANAAHVMSNAFDRTNVVSRELKDDLIKNNMGG